MASYPFLHSQETTDLTEWTKIQCDELQNIHADKSEICGLESESNQYLLSQYDSNNAKLYKFTANGQKAILEEIFTRKATYLYVGELFYLNNDQVIYKSFPTNDGCFVIGAAEVNTGNLISWYFSDFRIDHYHPFLLNNNHYALLFSPSKLYQFVLNEDSITIAKEDNLDYLPKQDTSILVSKDTFYYFSDSGLCAVTISGDSVSSSLIDCVTTKDEKSSIITDKKDRIWIISETDGVIEYNKKNNTARKIAEFPSNSLAKAIDMTKVCFYSEDYLYCITNEAVYFLLPPDEPDNPDNPDEPDNPDNAPDQSGHQCGCLGIEFLFALSGLFIFRLYRKH